MAKRLDTTSKRARACKALMDAVHAYRGKNEDFKPLW